MGLKIYSSTIGVSDEIALSIKASLEQIESEKICGIVFCGTSEAMGYHALLAEIKSAVYGALGRKVPVTLIPQYLLPKGGLAVEIYTLEGATDFQINEKNGVCYGLIESATEKMLFVEGIPASDFADKVSEQSREVFVKLDALLTE